MQIQICFPHSLLWGAQPDDKHCKWDLELWLLQSKNNPQHPKQSRGAKTKQEQVRLMLKFNHKDVQWKWFWRGQKLQVWCGSVSRGALDAADQFVALIAYRWITEQEQRSKMRWPQRQNQTTLRRCRMTTEETKSNLFFGGWKIENAERLFLKNGYRSKQY